jgi:hypothetical protein
MAIAGCISMQPDQPETSEQGMLAALAQGGGGGVEMDAGLLDDGFLGE